MASDDDNSKTQESFFEDERRMLSAMVTHFMSNTNVSEDVHWEIVDILHRHLRTEGTAPDKPWLAHASVREQLWVVGDSVPWARLSTDTLECLILNAKHFARQHFYHHQMNPLWRNPFVRNIWFRTETP